jgi:hypothetical protein
LFIAKLRGVKVALIEQPLPSDIHFILFISHHTGQTMPEVSGKTP